MIQIYKVVSANNDTSKKHEIQIIHIVFVSIVYLTRIECIKQLLRKRNGKRMHTRKLPLYVIKYDVFDC